MDALRTDSTTGLQILTLQQIRTGPTPGFLRRGSTVAYLDLIAFRDRVNAPFGHAVGDVVLGEVGRRLADTLSPWRVFRSAGDEFTVEVPGPLDRDGAGRLAHRIADALAAPFEQTGEGVEATVGICLRQVDDDPCAVWTAAQRAAHVEAPQRGLRVWIADEPA